MTSQLELVEDISNYIVLNVLQRHMVASVEKHSLLDSYKTNPIVVKYLSKLISGGDSPEGIARALYLPRVLGTSINTSFGTNVQKMFIDLGLASGSMISGMDIEFEDRKDGRMKWCQIKSGPNTINSEDVAPLIRKFTTVINLARTNNAFTNVRNSDFMIGVLYGETQELSMHYRVIDRTYPVVIGREFWERVTGYPNLYPHLEIAIHKKIANLETEGILEEGVRRLTAEIKSRLF